jgi:hypothetical protein
MRSDRVLRWAAVPPPPGAGGRPRRHGGEFVFADPATWGAPDVTTTTITRLYGPALTRSWNRLHPRLTHRSAWVHEGWRLPVIEGTVIRLEVARLPSGAIPRPVWLWYSGVDLPAAEVDRLWHAFLRRFDIEHTFRLLKQTLGWTCPKFRDPQAADTWTWLILAAYTRLRPGPPAGRRPAPPLGTTRRPQPAHPGPGPARVPEHPREGRSASRCTKTRQTRPRPTTRIEEPPPRRPPRGAHRHYPHGQGNQDPQSPAPPHRLKIKLESDVIAFHRMGGGMTEGDDAD